MVINCDWANFLNTICGHKSPLLIVYNMSTYFQNISNTSGRKSDIFSMSENLQCFSELNIHMYGKLA